MSTLGAGRQRATQQAPDQRDDPPSLIHLHLISVGRRHLHRAVALDLVGVRDLQQRDRLDRPAEVLEVLSTTPNPPLPLVGVSIEDRRGGASRITVPGQ